MPDASSEEPLERSALPDADAARHFCAFIALAATVAAVYVFVGLWAALPATVLLGSLAVKELDAYLAAPHG